MIAFSSGSTPSSLANIMRTPVKIEEGAEEPDHPLVLHEGGARCAMKMARKTSAPRMPKNSTRCWYSARDREVVEDHHEHEDVVDGERVLDHVAGQELERGLPGGLRAGRSPGWPTQPRVRAAKRWSM